MSALRAELAVGLGLLFACEGSRSSRAALIGATYPADDIELVDVLIVIDDSGSMRPYQQQFEAQLRAFAGVLTADLDSRIAITTTSVPGPTCAGALARGGELMTDTCRTAPEQAFIGPAELASDVLDLHATCTDACALDELDLRPSPLHDHADELALRPWLEGRTNHYGGNLPPGLGLHDALACVGMRGFGGCEFESPLAAASRALEHMRTPGDPAHGFLRDGARLLIMFIGNEDDCSHPAMSATIFDPAGERVFWSDPAADAPTSAVCHNASTLCDADGCTPVDRDLAGELTDDHAGAALRSLVEFQAELDTLALEREVIVSLVGGVRINGGLVWTEGGDPAHVSEFGWAPGCTAPHVWAQPPARLHALTRPASNAFSICDYDWSPALKEIAAWSGPQAPPRCGLRGVADLDPETPLLEPACEVLVRTAANDLWALPACERDADGWVIDPEFGDYVVPEGADRCHVLRNDIDGATEVHSDDVAVTCVDAGIAFELVVAARPDSLPLPHGSVYELACTPQNASS